MKPKTIWDLNRIAKKDNLRLLAGKGYYYWMGLTDEIELKLCSLFTCSVSVYRFSHMSFEKWLEELSYIKEQIEKIENKSA